MTATQFTGKNDLNRSTNKTSDMNMIRQTKHKKGELKKIPKNKADKKTTCFNKSKSMR
jgi:hypothetical protein